MLLYFFAHPYLLKITHTPHALCLLAYLGLFSLSLSLRYYRSVLYELEELRNELNDTVFVLYNDATLR